MWGSVWFRRDLRRRNNPALSAACVIGADYPVPIVNHLKTRNEYLELGEPAKANLR